MISGSVKTFERLSTAPEPMAKLKSLVRAETPILLSAGFIHLARRIGAELAITGTVQKVSNNSTEPAPSVAPPQSLLTEARRRLCGGGVGNLAPRHERYDIITAYATASGQGTGKPQLDGAGEFLACQSALNWAPLSASKRDPCERLVLAVALAPSELAGVATTARARAGT